MHTLTLSRQLADATAKRKGKTAGWTPKLSHTVPYPTLIHLYKCIIQKASVTGRSTVTREHVGIFPTLGLDLVARG
jgi:hypothetical protein